MAAIDDVCAYLKETGTYYLASCEGDRPRVRPFGTAHIYEGKLYIESGRKKAIYQQLKANPHIEICACKDDVSWLRVDARLVEDPRVEVEADLLDAYPELKGMYQAGDGNTVVFYLADAEATFSAFGSEPRTVTF